MSLVGKEFPGVTLKAMDYLGDDKEINVLEMCKKEGKKVLLFWYPKDFTYVCPTELFAFQETVEEFGKRNCLVLGASCDTNEVHFAWLSTPRFSTRKPERSVPQIGKKESAPWLSHVRG